MASLLFQLKRYFRHAFESFSRREGIFALGVLCITAVLLALPTGFEKPMPENSTYATARVLETDNRGIRIFGVVQQGEQEVRAKIEDGVWAGLEISGTNILLGKMDLDKNFRPGDRVHVVLDAPGPGLPPHNVTFLDFWRIPWQALMLGAFLFLLVLYGGWTGIKTLAAFLFSVAALWKLLIPGILGGLPPLLVSLGLVALLSAVIIYLVAGLNRVGTSAFLGCLLGVAATTVWSLVLAGPFRINGAVLPFSETLYYNGWGHLDLNQIFLAGTFLASSGAIMDLAIDVASAMGEVRSRRPDLGFLGLLSSGLRVGRTVFGTMTTTLLLAYTGGFTTLLMVFMVQGIPWVNMLNLGYLSGEIFHTLSGVFGLVLVAPFTAVIAAALLWKTKPTA